MNKTQFLGVLVVLLFCSFSLSAQSQTPLQVINYNKNVEPPLTFAEKAMLQEVYAEKLDDYILSKPERLKDVKDILRNRFEIIEIKGKDVSGLKKLSDVPLFNHYNSSLTRDVVFNKSQFNPLKYEFNFHSRNSSYVKVDNTNYIIKIKSQFER